MDQGINYYSHSLSLSLFDSTNFSNFPTFRTFQNRYARDWCETAGHGMNVKQSMAQSVVSVVEIDKCCTYDCAKQWETEKGRHALEMACMELDMFVDLTSTESDTLSGCCRQVKCEEVPSRCLELHLEADPSKAAVMTGVEAFQQSCCRKQSLKCDVFDVTCRKNGKTLRSPELRPAYAQDILEDCCVDSCLDDTELGNFCRLEELQPKKLSQRVSPSEKEKETGKRMSSAEQKIFKTKHCCMGYYCSDFYNYDANGCDRFSEGTKVRKSVPKAQTYVSHMHVSTNTHTHTHTCTNNNQIPRCNKRKTSSA